MDEDVFFNADETKFFIDMSNGRKLTQMGDRNIKYSDVVSVKSVMTMMVMLSGGRPAFLQPPFLVLQNPTSNYPTMGVTDNVVEVIYRTQPKGWMDWYFLNV